VRLNGGSRVAPGSSESAAAGGRTPKKKALVKLLALESRFRLRSAELRADLCYAFSTGDAKGYSHSRGGRVGALELQRDTVLECVRQEPRFRWSEAPAIPPAPLPGYSTVNHPSKRGSCAMHPQTIPEFPTHECGKDQVMRLSNGPPAAIPNMGCPCGLHSMTVKQSFA